MTFLSYIFVGFFATLLFDLYQILLKFAYEIDKSKWGLVGRYFIHCYKGTYKQNDINTSESFDYENIIGYAAHYMIGIFYGFFYIFVNYLFFDNASLFIAITFGLLTVLGNWCIMMPYAFNLGFFGLKNNNFKKIWVQNLVIHFIFGVGLYIGLKIIL